MFTWRQFDGRPIIVAHRGASHDAPENTLAAFELALLQKADAIELDARLTKDGEVVVIHDATLRRTTNGGGYVHHRSLDSIRKLDAGLWFDPSFAAEQVPTLDEVLNLVNRRCGVNIELKPVSNKLLGERLVAQCLDILNGYRSTDHILITSFQHSLLKRAKDLMPGVLTGVLYDPIRHRMRLPSQLAHAVGAEVFVCALRFLRHRIVEDARRNALSVAAYTVDTPVQLKRARHFGIEILVTNKPGYLRGLIDL